MEQIFDFLANPKYITIVNRWNLLPHHVVPGGWLRWELPVPLGAIVALCGLALVGSGGAKTLDPSLMPEPSRSRGTLSATITACDASLAGRLDNQ
jgi:hypothetical protein